MVAYLERMVSYLQQGGFVMWPLLLGAALLWYAIGYRLISLRRGSWLSLRALVVRAKAGQLLHAHGAIERAVCVGLQVQREHPDDIEPHLKEAFTEFEEEFQRFALIIWVVVGVAPLAGLLGTVAGMIETFDALGDMTLIRQGGGIAGGIAQALISTQMGLAVAIPGLLMGAWLRRKQTSLEQELEQLKQILCLTPQAYSLVEPGHTNPSKGELSNAPATTQSQGDAMRFGRRKKSGDIPVDISPLIDMVFILLIFFMVSTTFVKDLKIDIERPSANTASKASTKAIRVHLERSGGVHLDGTPTQVWMLQSRLRSLLKHDPARPVLVITDRLVQAEKLIEVVDQCRLAGAKDVGVATQREAG